MYILSKGLERERNRNGKSNLENKYYNSSIINFDLYQNIEAYITIYINTI